MLRKELKYYSVARRLDTTVRRLATVGRLESTAYADLAKKKRSAIRRLRYWSRHIAPNGGNGRVQCVTNSCRYIET